MANKVTHVINCAGR